MRKDKTNKKQEKKLRAKKIAEKKERRSRWKALLPLIKTFSLWLILVGIVHQFISFFGPFLIEFTTETLFLFTKVFFIPSEIIGPKLISLFNFNVEVVMECTAYNYYLFAVALILFARWPLKDKIINLLIFVATIFVLNNLRFVILGFIGQYYPDSFDSIHDYFWNILFALMILGVWMWRNDSSMKKMQTSKIKTD